MTEGLSNLDGDLASIIETALRAVDAGTLVEAACCIDVPARTLQIRQHAISLTNVQRIRVVGAGKAAGKMAAGLEVSIGEQAKALGVEISGQVNVTDANVIECGRVNVIGCRPSGYNFPTEKVVQQTQVVANIVKGLQAGDVCLALISGGGSALLELPKIPLKDLVAVSKALSQSGADILCLNTVRQCLSAVKAGGLARMMPAEVLTPMTGLIISDVIGDNLAMVSSGPTVVDAPLQIKAAAEILHRMLAPSQIPDSVAAVLKQSPKTETSVSSVDNILIGNIHTAIDAATTAARRAGFEIANSVHASIDACANVAQLARQYARYVASWPQSAKPTALIAGGEPTVRLADSPGIGGRNLQLTAMVLEEIIQLETVPNKIQFASVGTDGEDGSAPVAGGWFDQELAHRLVSDDHLRMELKRAIRTNDCYRFFHWVGYCINPPSDVQTNVCDLQIMLIEPKKTSGISSG